MRVSIGTADDGALHDGVQEIFPAKSKTTAGVGARATAEPASRSPKGKGWGGGRRSRPFDTYISIRGPRAGTQSGAQATSNARFVELRAGPIQAAARWIEVGGARCAAWSVLAGDADVRARDVSGADGRATSDRLERFFFERGAPADHEVSPQSDPATLALLTERGYRPIEFTSVMFRPVGRGLGSQRPDVIVRVIGADRSGPVGEDHWRGWARRTASSCWTWHASMPARRMATSFSPSSTAGR